MASGMWAVVSVGDGEVGKGVSDGVVGKSVGMVRIDATKNIGEISININPKFRGISLSETLLSDAIKAFHKKKPNCTLVANIIKKNSASIKIFGSIGFVKYKSTKNIYTYRLNFEK